MQTVRRYVFFSAIGLLAALAFAPQDILFQSSSASDGGSAFTQTAMLHLFAAILIFMVFRQAVVGIPNMFREKIQRLKRTLMLVILVSLTASMFMIGL